MHKITKSIITTEKLKKLNACKSGIKFFENNFPNGIDLKKVKVAGDYENFYFWLKQELKLKKVYDQKNNLIKKEYDQKNNLIKKVYPSGSIYEYEYDHNNNLIKEVYPNGDIYEYKYDQKNNLIKKVYPDGDIYEYKYDQKNNLIKKVYPDGDTCEYIFKYDQSGRLIQAEDMIIEYLN